MTQANSNQMFSLTGRVAVVTGGGGILGVHFCRTLAQAGASVVMVDQAASEGVSSAQKLSSEGLSVQFEACDISDEKQVVSLVEKIKTSLGGIHILVNNAASKSKSLDRFFDPFEDFQLATWNEVMDVNVTGSFLMCKHIGRLMIDQKIKGSMIQIASVYGVVAPDQRIYDGSQYNGRAINTPAVYSASKAAVIGLTQYLATYWGEKGIRVNTLTPGGVASGQNEVFNKKYSARVPMGRMGQAQDLQGALLFLASEASGYITGQNIVVDGGLTVW